MAVTRKQIHIAFGYLAWSLLGFGLINAALRFFEARLEVVFAAVFLSALLFVAMEMIRANFKLTIGQLLSRVSLYVLLVLLLQYTYMELVRLESQAYPLKLFFFLLVSIPICAMISWVLLKLIHHV